MAKLSPMMQQYINIKEDHLEEIVFFRLGDFYEMFFDDAKTASKELELTLTGKDCGTGERAPMCGIPYHSCDAYIARLIQKGYKVAICEQVEDPALAKGLVKRDVVRVITPGTVIETSMLDESKNNYICSIFVDEKVGICFADVSTGEIFITELDFNNKKTSIIDEIAGFEPKEFILNTAAAKENSLTRFIKERLDTSFSVVGNCVYDSDNVDEFVYNRFCDDKYKKWLKGKNEAVFSLCALIEYVSRMQKIGLERLTTLNFYNDNQFMHLGITARTNLELCQTIRTNEKKGSLLWVLDKTRTSMGKRLLKREIERPLLDCKEIKRRQCAVGELVFNVIMRNEISEQLSGIYDIERLLSRIVFGSVTARELKSLQYTTEKLPLLKQQLANSDNDLLKQIFEDIDTLEDIGSLIESAIVENPPISVKEGGLIKVGYNSEIDELKDILDNGKYYLSKLESDEKEKTGIKNLKVAYNKVFGYYIEVTKSNLDLVPEYFIRKQTLANNERYITEELKELETKIISANDKIVKLEQQLLSELRDIISSNLFRIESCAKAIARLDFLYSLATVASENNYVCPEVNNENVIDIKEGRHPVVEKFSQTSLFVANDTLLDNDENLLLIITGPNMAGKSTYMRQTALIVIMAQIGSFVPCSAATIGICDKIFTRIGASDDLTAGQSTFMVEMNELAHILKNATPNSLIILDEIGRGTSTFDGMSIAKSVIEYIITNKNLCAKTLFATHYHELTDIEDEYSSVKNYNIAVKKRGDDITFLRRIVRGPADDSYGIEVAKLAGVPDEVVVRAKEILEMLENDEPNENKRVAKQSPNCDVDLHVFSVLNTIKNLDVTTLTPIEALNILYKISNDLK